ncbi:MAG: tRNA (adenosine(37)-N6)-dimethylallyltransferase MiaA [Clostridia bacterium]|jgi:tRNA dimethylallyltransferase|nr:tRNA (adenosine(37)-N6)-dimethylallyltransferase MiaA [Clostridia bacterium]
MKNPLLLIVGLTATGKTNLAIEISKKLNAEIISADSMQIYKQMDIGTAKATQEELMQCKHHLIDILEPQNEYSVAEYKEQAEKIIADLYKKHKLPIIVGGTGLYTESLLYPYSFAQLPKNEEIRNKYKALSNEFGNDYLLDLLKKIDPAEAEKSNDERRIIRALEIYELTGKTKSEHNLEQDKTSPYDFYIVALNADREIINNRINLRVDKMFESGLVTEVKNLLAQGVPKTAQSMQAIGYKEIIENLEGNITLDEAKELIKNNTRHYAKRQLTWLKHMKNINWFDISEKEKAINSVLQKFSSFKKEDK